MMHMIHTMIDLQDVVADHMYEAVHGREINTEKFGPVLVPHMLGITPIGVTHSEEEEHDTLLDANHPFWERYDEDIETNAEAQMKIITAIKILKENDRVSITYPDGRDGDTMYIEIEPTTTPDTDTHTAPRAAPATTRCAVCGAQVDAVTSIEEDSGCYFLQMCVDCEHCGTGSQHSLPFVRD